MDKASECQAKAECIAQVLEALFLQPNVLLGTAQDEWFGLPTLTKSPKAKNSHAHYHYYLIPFVDCGISLITIAESPSATVG